MVMELERSGVIVLEETQRVLQFSGLVHHG